MTLGLRYLHKDKHIVHRDLKPDNVLIAYENGEEIIKISDFGISKILGYPTVAANYPKNYRAGTPFYWAPEQNNYDKVRLPADIWAIGKD